MAIQTPFQPAREPLTCWFAGLATLDVIHRATRPERHEKVTAHPQKVAPVGPAANADETAEAIGARSVLVTALGTSAVGTAARADLERHGVEVHDVVHADHSLAVSAVLVDDDTGERSVVSADGALTQVQGPPPEVLAALPVPDVVLLDGHHPEIARTVLAHVRTLRPRPHVVLDAGRWRPVFAELLPAADVVACSAAFRVPTGSEAWYQGLTAATVVTRGSAPVQWCSGGSRGVLEVPRVRVVDTLGAGDAFHGALAVAVARGLALPGACAEAVRVASLRVQHAGPRAWLAHLGSGPGGRADSGTGRDTGVGAGTGTGDSAGADAGIAGAGVGAGAEIEVDAGAGADAGGGLPTDDGRTEPRDVALAQSAEAAPGDVEPVTGIPDRLVERARRLADDPDRTGTVILGITGPPGAGKSTLAAGLAAALGPQRATVVGMDGFHLANTVLEARGRRDRKGAIDTFDDEGFADLLRRIVTAPADGPAVLAPEFRREIEEPIAGAVVVRPGVPLVITEGNYLLAESGSWPRARGYMSEVWYVDLDDETRLDRLTARHHVHGKPLPEAYEWAHGSDQRNAEIVAATRGRADLHVTL